MRDASKALAFGLALLLAFTGCAYRKAVVVEDLFVPLANEAPRVPTPADLAAARLARAVLVAGARSPGVGEALAALEAAPRQDDERRLDLLARDLRNAALDDPLADREASRKLRRRIARDPRLAGRLDDLRAADPLAQARLRTRDDWHRLFARTFNSVAQPLGQSAITGFLLAPYQLANSALHYFAEFSNREALSTSGRQALALREAFLAAHPDSPIAPELTRLVERDRRRLAKTLALRRVRAAERALDAGQPGLALHQAKGALEPSPTGARAPARLRRRAERSARKAEAALARSSEHARASLEAESTDARTRASERALATALLIRPGSPVALGPVVADYASEAGEAGAGRIAFVHALARFESGHEEAARRTLAREAGSGARARRLDSMTRHARQLLDDDEQNPWDAFVRRRRVNRREALAFRLAGEWVTRPRYPNLWSPVAYVIDTPTIAMTLVMAPLRAMISPFTGFPDFHRGTALAGYRYLLRHPSGEHQQAVVEWLYDYERGEDRPGRALRLADLMPDFPADERLELVEAAAQEQVGDIDRVDRRDRRASILRGVASEYPDSEGGRDAGLRVREELEKASPQNIRITRGFLQENPSVAGPNGLGLDPGLLNGDPRDGELHAEGIVLRGARVVEVRLRSEGRDEDAMPEVRMRRISKERLTRLTSALDEAVRRNDLIDEGARFASDANREAYLERARLGLTEDPDLRASAESDFVYQSLRERYGVVRGRDSLLPFDLVFRGSLGDFSLGAFPRWRMPQETDDAYLYR